MNRAKALKILNPILAVIFLCQVCTGLLHKYIFYKVYDMVHGGGGIVLLAAVIIHLYLNWTWVRSNFVKK